MATAERTSAIRKWTVDGGVTPIWGKRASKPGTEFRRITFADAHRVLAVVLHDAHPARDHVRVEVCFSRQEDGVCDLVVLDGRRHAETADGTPLLELPYDSGAPEHLADHLHALRDAWLREVEMGPHVLSVDVNGYYCLMSTANHHEPLSREEYPLLPLDSGL